MRRPTNEANLTRSPRAYQEEELGAAVELLLSPAPFEPSEPFELLEVSVDELLDDEPEEPSDDELDELSDEPPDEPDRLLVSERLSVL